MTELASRLDKPEHSHKSILFSIIASAYERAHAGPRVNELLLTVFIFATGTVQVQLMPAIQAVQDMHT